MKNERIKIKVDLAQVDNKKNIECRKLGDWPKWGCKVDSSPTNALMRKNKIEVEGEEGLEWKTTAVGSQSEK